MTAGQFPALSFADRGAEMAALGSILMAADPAAVADEVFGLAPAVEFWGERELAEVIEGMWRQGRPIDPQLLLADLMSSGLAQKVGGAPHLHDLIQRAWSVDHAKFYADAIHEAWRRRVLAQAGMTAMQRAENGTVDIAEAAIEMMGRAEEVLGSQRSHATDPPTDVLDFAQGPSTFDWIVPGLIERLDRIMITAAEGTGKTAVLWQIAIAVAAGRHPFSMAEIEPRRALVVDCEVSPRQQRRRWKWLINRAENAGCPLSPGMLRVEPRPDGLDLVGADLPWLKAKVRASAADLVVIGPLYRLHRRNINDEEVARELVGALDEVRVGSNVALLVEAHAGHAQVGKGGERDLRPRGSSLFLGWAEFGCALRPVKNDRRIVDVTRWRGDRDVRYWPHRLRWSGDDTMAFPWVECAPDEGDKWQW